MKSEATLGLLTRASQIRLITSSTTKDLGPALEHPPHLPVQTDQGGLCLLARLCSGLCSLQKQLLRDRTSLGQERVSLPDWQLTWDWFLSASSKASAPGRLHGLEDSSSSPVGAWQIYLQHPDHGLSAHRLRGRHSLHLWKG